MEVLFLGSAICLLQQVPHAAPGEQCTGQTRLMTRPSYQLMTGDDGKLVSTFPSFSLHLHTAVIPLLALSGPLRGHQSLCPHGTSQLTYSGCKCAGLGDEQLAVGRRSSCFCCTW